MWNYSRRRMGVHSIMYALVVVLCQKVVAPPGSYDDPLLTYSQICDEVTGFCYQAFSFSRTYVDAWFACHSLGMHLALPKTQQEIDFITANITGGVNHAGFWIGLVDVWTEMEWTWLDMELANDTLIPWKTHEPKDSKGHEEDCVEIKHDGWNNAKCSLTKPYLCQSHLTSCSSRSTYLYNGKCYRLITGHFLWLSTLCAGLGGTLAMPKTTDVNNYINNINYEVNEVWIGLNGLPYSCDYTWVDGDCIALSSIENFLIIPNEPNQVTGVVMTTGGLWDGITDSAYETSYVCQIDLDCGEYDVRYGVMVSGDTTLGAIHSYICDQGYVAAHSYTECQPNGIWAPTPVCLVDCGNYDVVNGYAITSVTTAGTNLTYACRTNYVPRNYTVCQTSGAWEPTPVCLRDCGKYDVVNGYTITGVTTEGKNLTYTCQTNYVPRNYTVCQSSGAWEPTPACIRVNGYTITGVTTEGTNLTYTCQTNYMPRNYTVCQASGAWEQAPSCLRDCGRYTIQNGDTISGLTMEGASYGYTCDQDFRPIIDPVTVCMANGSWTPTPVCVHAGCVAQNVSNGQALLETSSVGTNRSVVCDVGYTPGNSNWTVCGETGKWEPVPECVVDLTKTCLCVPITESNFTLEEKVEYYVNVLRLQKETLSSTRRQLTSAADDRTSARGVGYVGAGVLFTTGCLIVMPDALRVLQVAKLWLGSKRY